MGGVGVCLRTCWGLRVEVVKITDALLDEERNRGETRLYSVLRFRFTLGSGTRERR